MRLFYFKAEILFLAKGFFNCFLSAIGTKFSQLGTKFPVMRSASSLQVPSARHKVIEKYRAYGTNVLEFRCSSKTSFFIMRA